MRVWYVNADIMRSVKKMRYAHTPQLSFADLLCGSRPAAGAKTHSGKERAFLLRIIKISGAMLVEIWLNFL